MTPLKKVYLHQSAGSYDRIGPNTRHVDGNDYAELEIMLEKLCPLVVTCDIKTIHAPYFTEFCYYDILGGLSLATLSAEINYRMAYKALNCPADAPFPLGYLMDKYVLDKPKKKYKKVVLLPGSNSVDLIDQCLLQKIMMDDEWMLKPHPITREETLREMASVYGYARIIDPKESGLALIEEAEEIATLSTSELYLVARLLGKPVTNITRYDRAWLSTYGHFVHWLDNTDDDIRKISNFFMSPLSGYIRPEYEENKQKELAINYFEAAMEERENFKMVSNQKLVVADKTILAWDNN